MHRTTKLLTPLLCSSLVLLTFAGATAWAGPVTIPHTFAANTPAVAAQVNQNFGAVEAAVNDNDNRLAALEAVVASQAVLISNLQSQLAAVQGSNVMALDPYLVLVDVPDPVEPSILYPTVQFTGLNVQIVNGTDTTDTTNGLGNLIIGYNEPDPLYETEFCSLGYYDTQNDCVSNGATWAAYQHSGSHNLIVGAAHAYTRHGGMVVGYRNIINGAYATVSGGIVNQASGDNSSVSGGSVNTASNYFASVSGGQSNVASGRRSSVCGGWNNVASGQYATVSGGYDNEASEQAASVSGGIGRTATDWYDWAAGSLYDGG